MISDFTDEHAFLSNYYVGSPIQFGKYTALSGEHLFQAMKCRDGLHFRKILACDTPGAAKAEGRHLLHPRPDWERVKLDVMRLVLGLKFTLARAEGTMLLATGSQLLMEINTWNDRIWGATLSEHRDNPEYGGGPVVGRSWLGVLLMARRAELLAEDADDPGFDYTTTIDFIRYRPATEDR